MKNKPNITKMLLPVAKHVLKARRFIIVIAIIGLLGYGGYLISQIIALQPDQTYLATQRQANGSTKINFDKPTITTINGLVQINPKIDLTNIGKSDPFSP